MDDVHVRRTYIYFLSEYYAEIEEIVGGELDNILKSDE